MNQENLVAKNFCVIDSMNFKNEEDIISSQSYILESIQNTMKIFIEKHLTEINIGS